MLMSGLEKPTTGSLFSKSRFSKITEDKKLQLENKKLA